MSATRVPTAFLVGVPALVVAVVWVHGRLDGAPRREAAGAALVVVSSSSDDGPGTLREAIFAANASETRARIALEITDVELLSPLPPLVTEHGVTLVGDSTVIRGDFGDPILDVRSPGALLQGVRLEGSGQTCVRVFVADVVARNLHVLGCGVAIDVLDEAHRFELRESALEENDIGVRVAPSAEDGRIVGTSFLRHRSSAIWSVGPVVPGRRRPLVIERNEFSDQRFGMVLGNRPALVEDNDVTDAEESGIYALGEGVTMTRNRITGANHGIVANATASSLIAGNEVAQNRAIGILVTSARDTHLRDNRAYRNAYGVVVLFGVEAAPNRLIGNVFLGNDQDGLAVWGASPIVRGNASTRNGGAGMRFLDIVTATGARLVADPFLRDNELRGNRQDGPVRGSYPAS